MIRRGRIHVKVELAQARQARSWRIARLALGTGDAIDCIDRHIERPKRVFRSANDAVAGAKRLAWTRIHKEFGPVPADAIIWEITPPDYCPERRTDSR